jgi:hypothetical protein
LPNSGNSPAGDISRTQQNYLGALEELDFQALQNRADFKQLLSTHQEGPSGKE